MKGTKWKKARTYFVCLSLFRFIHHNTRKWSVRKERFILFTLLLFNSCVLHSPLQLNKRQRKRSALIHSLRSFHSHITLHFLCCVVIKWKKNKWKEVNGVFLSFKHNRQHKEWNERFFFFPFRFNLNTMKEEKRGLNWTKRKETRELMCCVLSSFTSERNEEKERVKWTKKEHSTNLTQRL